MMQVYTSRHTGKVKHVDNAIDKGAYLTMHVKTMSLLVARNSVKVRARLAAMR